MRILIAAFLILSLALGPLQNVWANGASADPAIQAAAQLKAGAEQAFLRDVKDQVLVFMQQNQGQVRAILACLRGKYEGAGAAQYCEEKISGIRTTIATLYPKYRTYQLILNWFDLHSLDDLGRNFSANIYANFDKRAPAYLAADKIFTANPLRVSTKIIDIDWLNKPALLPQTEFTDAEINSAVSGDGLKLMLYKRDVNGEMVYDDSGEPTYESLPYDLSVDGLIHMLCDRTTIHKAQVSQICQGTRLRYSSDKKALYFEVPKHEDQWAHLNMAFSLGDLAREYFSLVFEARSVALDQFYKTAQDNPYVALVSSANPTNEELIQAFSVIQKNADDTVSEYMATKTDLDKSWDRSKYFKLMAYEPVTTSLAHFPGDYYEPYNDLVSAEAIKAGLQHEYNLQQLIYTGLEMGGIMAANIAVCYGLSEIRVIKRLAFLRQLSDLNIRKFLNPICFSSLSILQSAIMISFSKSDYNSTYRAIFSAVDDKNVVREMKTLSSAEQAIILNWVFLPIGAVPLVKLIKNQIPALSLAAQQHLQNTFTKLKGF
jgi:hypothetical protein